MRKAIVFVVLAVFGLCANVARSEDGQSSDLQAAVDSVVTQESKDPWTPAVSLKLTYKTDYVTGNGYANGSAPQQDVFALLPCGFSLDFWHSGGSYKDFDADFADEVDYTIGYGKEFDLLGRTFRFDAAVGYFDLYELGDGDGDILDPSIVVSTTFDLGTGGTLTPSIKLEDAILMPMGLDRWITTVGVSHSIDLGIGGAALTNTVKYVYDNGTSETPSGNLLRWRVGLDVPLNDSKSVVAGIGYERYWMGHTIEDRKDVGSLDVSLTLNF